MSGQMCWLSPKGTGGKKILHVRTHPYQPWRPYTACFQFAVPDYPVPGGSSGWATSQKLMQAGWTLVPSTQVQEALLMPQLKRA